MSPEQQLPPFRIPRALMRDGALHAALKLAAAVLLDQRDRGSRSPDQAGLCGVLKIEAYTAKKYLAELAAANVIVEAAGGRPVAYRWRRDRP